MKNSHFIISLSFYKEGTCENILVEYLSHWLVQSWWKAVWLQPLSLAQLSSAWQRSPQQIAHSSKSLSRGCRTLYFCLMASFSKICWIISFFYIILAMLTSNLMSYSFMSFFWCSTRAMESI